MEMVMKLYHKKEIKSVKCEKVEEDLAMWIWHLSVRNCTLVEEVKERAKLFASTVCFYPINPLAPDFSLKF
jgi:hypothetical protein